RILATCAAEGQSVRRHLAGRGQRCRPDQGGYINSLASTITSQRGSTARAGTGSYFEEDNMAFTLPNLPYAPSALEPHIDTQTMEIHHGRHHKAYVDNLNKALEGEAALQAKSIEQLLRDIAQVPDKIRQAVINNGGGHANHSMFWEIMGAGA